MRYIIFGLAVALFATVFTPAARAGEEYRIPKEAVLPTVKIPVGEDVLLAFADEATGYFYRAHEYFLKKDLKASSAEIHVGAALLDLAAADAVDDVDLGSLESASDELTALADDVEQGKVTSVLDLDPVFADAYRALAGHHHRKAWEAWNRKETEKAGRHLRAAARYVERGAASGGRRLEAASVSALEAARLVSGKLIEGSGWVSGEVGKGLEAVGKEVDRLGEKVEPAR